MRILLLSLLLSPVLCTAQTVTITPGTTYQTIGGWFNTQTFPDLSHTTAYYAASKAVVDGAVYNGLFRMNGIQVAVEPGDMYMDQDYFAQFRAGSLITTNYIKNYSMCPAQGGDTRDSHSTFQWDAFVAPALTAIAAAGNQPVIEFRFTWGDENGAGTRGPNCTGAAGPPAWWNDTVNGTGWANYFTKLVSTGRTTLSEVNSGRYYISLLNEPNFNTFRSNYWTNARLGSLAIAVRSALDTAGYTGVKIICCEWEDLALAPAGIAAVRAAAGPGKIDVWASHLYHGNTTQNYIDSYNAAIAAGGEGMWQLEWFNGGITSLHNVLKYHWAGYEKFADGQEALGTCGVGDDYSMVAITSTACAAPFSNPVYRVRGGSESQSGLMAPYFNTIKRGAVGVDAATTDANYDPVAFRNPDGSYLVHVWVKNTGVTNTVTVNGLPANTYTWKYTRDNSNVLVTGGTLTCGGGTSCSAAVPGSVTTPGAVLSFLGATPTPPPGPTTYYASPTGTSSGDGSIANPWDFRTMVARTNLIAGSTVYLRGGVHTGRFVTAVAGQPGSPITIRSYPGEWAILDGNVTGTLAADLSSSAGATTCTLTAVGAFPNTANTGFQAIIDTEVLSFNNPTVDTPVWTNCVRNQSGSDGVAAHTAGTTIYMTGAILDISGTDTIWRDFEVRNGSSYSRIDLSGNNQLALDRRGNGVMVHGARSKVVNLVVHDTEDGIDAWQQASDTDIYGNIIYNVGTVTSNRSHGHGLYQENINGPRKILENAIVNTASWATQMYGVSGSFLNGYLQGNVIAGAGGIDSVNNTCYQNLIVGTNSQPIPSVIVEENFIRHAGTCGATNVALGYGGLTNDTMIFRNNYVSGGIPLGNSPWTTLTGSGNTLYGAFDRIFSAVTITNFGWNNNGYYDLTPVRNCSGGNRRAPFTYNSIQGGCSGLDFIEWKANTGADASSTYTQAKPPNAVYVRPNAYQTGRANIIAYNWMLEPAVSVDLSTSGLVNGQAYEIRNAANYLGAPVLAGNYSSASPVVSLPMNSTEALAVAAPLGLPTPAASSLPEFGVFVVVPGATTTSTSAGSRGTVRGNRGR